MKHYEKLWNSHAATAYDRGKLVVDLLSRKLDLKGKKVLDVGCGVGGTALALSETGADVTAIDTQPEKLERLKQKDIRIRTRTAYGEHLPFDRDHFDAVVLQDVIEHTGDPGLVLQEISRVLKPSGWMFFQTPNKWSVINFFSDPHWGVPLVSVTKRKTTFRLISKFYKLETEWRDDFAQLLSPREILSLLSTSGFRYQFIHKDVVKEMFENPSRVVSSGTHLSILKNLKFLKTPLQWTVPDGEGLLNWFVTPAWYLLCQKL